MRRKPKPPEDGKGWPFYCQYGTPYHDHPGRIIFGARDLPDGSIEFSQGISGGEPCRCQVEAEKNNGTNKTGSQK